MPYKVEALPNSYTDLGEGPHWDVESQSLYYVDLNAGMLLRYDYQHDKVFRAKIVGENLSSFVIPIDGEEDKFAVGCGRRVMIVNWDGVSSCATVDRQLFAVQQEDERHYGNRFNDAKCDPAGRLFAGTMRFVGDEFKHRYGQLFKYEAGKVLMVKSNIGISNGLAWNCQAGKFYFIDTTDFNVKEYNYDFENGKKFPGRAKVVLDLHKSKSCNPKDNLWPDGMTIDTEGNIYVATFNGQTIYKVNPCTGKVLLEIKFPCKQITSCAFGGPKLDILYVTTSSRFDEPHPAGTTYKVTGLCAKGLPMNKMRL